MTDPLARTWKPSEPPRTNRNQGMNDALHIARDGDGFVVDYAIADVAAVVIPDGALDAETRRRAGHDDDLVGE